MKKIVLLIMGMMFFIVVSGQNQEINGTLTTVGGINIGKHITGKWGEGARLYLQGTDSSNDPIWLAKYTGSQEITDLRINIGDAPTIGDRLVVGITHWSTKYFHELFAVRADGNVGIGVAQPTSKLDVNGTIRAKEVKIEATGWADFVFAKDYQLPTLTEVKAHIEEKKHLPNIPSEAEVKENGVNIGELQIKLLQKIEELTLYVIKQEERAVEQQKQIDALQEQLSERVDSTK